MLGMFFVGHIQTPSAILNDAWSKIENAKSIAVTLVVTTEEFKRESRTSYAFRKGGYFRAQSKNLVDVSNPKQAWTFRSDTKTYQSRPPLPKEFNLGDTLGLEFFHAGLSSIGHPTKTTWHGKSVLRIELDGRKSMTRETKLFVFIDMKDHIPYGFSANLGSITQVTVFENLKINPKLDDHIFEFRPPKGWKLVTTSNGGWK